MSRGIDNIKGNVQSPSARAWSRRSRRFTPNHWMQLIQSLSPRSLRVKVACLVWWEYFSNQVKSGREHDDTFDFCLTRWGGMEYEDIKADEPTADDLKIALVNIGYPDETAEGVCMASRRWEKKEASYDTNKTRRYHSTAGADAYR